MNNRILLGCVCAFAGLSVSATTWHWSPTVKDGSNNYQWNNAANWLSADDGTTRGYPHYGDTALIGEKSTAQSYNVCNNDVNCALQEVRFTQGATMNQGNVVLLAGGKGLQYLATAGYTGNWMGAYLVGVGEVPFNVTNNVDFALQMRFLKKTNAQNPVANPILVKEGRGRFICFNQGQSQEYDIPLALIRQGVLNFTNYRQLIGCSFAFDGNDGSQRLELCYTSGYKNDINLQSGALFETNGVANTTHGVMCDYDKQIVFTGTPPMNPMVFSGTWYRGAGFKWNPGADSYVFVCSNAVSATTGRVDVAKGVVKLVTGASFTALGSLSVSAGAEFRVESASGSGFSAKTLTLGGDTAKVYAEEGVTLAFASGTLGGAPLKQGTYTADGADGTRTAAWLTGGGAVTVQTGPSDTAAWVGGGAGDTSLYTAANWAEGLPDFVRGELFATFATSGTSALLPVTNVPPLFAGFALQNGFTFEAAAGALPAKLGASGMTLADAASATVYTMGWPLELLAGQTWSVGAKNTLNLTAPLSGTGALTIGNGGTVNLGTTTDYAAALTLAGGAAKGTYNITGLNALGAGATPVAYASDRVTFTFTACTNERPLAGAYLLADDGITYTYPAGTTAEFRGKVSANGNMTLSAGAGATAVYRGGLELAGGGGCSLYLNGTGRIEIRENPINMTGGGNIFIYSGNNPTLDLYVSGCRISNTFWTEWRGGTVNAYVNNAWLSNTRLVLASPATVDLHGTTQTLLALAGSGTVKSDAPAQWRLSLTGNFNNDWSGNGRTNATVFAGNVSLYKTGEYPFAVDVTSTSTGTVQVAGGNLMFCANGAWPNCTNVTVSGGSLTLKNANAFGDLSRGEREKPKALWNVSSGSTVNLNYTGRIHCTAIWVDGATTDGGTYGAVGSGADHEYAFFTGSGLLYVARKGTAIFVR